jgi:hypothetical protein
MARREAGIVRCWERWRLGPGTRHLNDTTSWSSIGSIAAALDPRVRSVVLLLMADDFTDVVWTGRATQNVKSSLARRFSLEEVRSAWSIISPATTHTI